MVIEILHLLELNVFKTENRIVKTVGMYTPDFLIIRRNKDNK